MGTRGHRLTRPIATRRAEHDLSTADPDQLDLGLRGEPRGQRGRERDATGNAMTLDSPHTTVRVPGAPSPGRFPPPPFALTAVATLLAFAALPRVAAASAAGGASMPWDTPLQNLLSNLSGPTARALVLIAIVACGLLWAFTRNEEGLKKLGQIAFGGAIALGAVTLVTSLGFSGAML
jgi:type IV secretion system protein VirB2